MPAGPGEKIVVEFLAHDSFHGPANVGHVFTVGDAHRSNHETQIPRTSRKIKGCAGVIRILEANSPELTPSLPRVIPANFIYHFLRLWRGWNVGQVRNWHEAKFCGTAKVGRDWGTAEMAGPIGGSAPVVTDLLRPWTLLMRSWKSAVVQLKKRRAR